MIGDFTVGLAREFYAEELQLASGLHSEALVRALATVPRERFLGPGPWHIVGGDANLSGRGGYQITPDAHPRRVYHNVAIAIDPARLLNNGQPGLLAGWLDALSIADGSRAAHVGCGTGYFTALMAEMVGPSGHIVAYEVDEALAAASRKNLRDWPQVTVHASNGCDAIHGSFDIILVNAGVTHPAPRWLDALGHEGRLLIPLTFDVPGSTACKGATFVVTRRGDKYEVAMFGMVAIYPCTGGRTPELNAAVQQAFTSGRFFQVKSLRRDTHEESAACFVHGDGWCLSSE